MDSPKRQAPKRIGELLVAANIIKADLLAEALEISKSSGTPIGRVLLSLGQLEENAIDVALQVQGMIKAKVISPEFGIRVINVAIKGNMPIANAFARLGWRSPKVESTNISEFDDLVLKSGILTKSVLENAKITSQKNNLPLGRVLVMNRNITPSLLTSVLTAQVLIRDGKIKLEEAIEALKQSLSKQMAIEACLNSTSELIKYSQKLKLGDLLTASGIISETDKISAVEIGLVQKKPIGQILIECNLISQELLNDCLKLQNMVSDGRFTDTTAINILKDAHNKGLDVNDMIAKRLDFEKDIELANSLKDLVNKSGIVSLALENKLKSGNSDPRVSFGEILLSSGILTKSMLTALVQTKRLLAENILTPEQAYQVLSKCQMAGSDFFRELEFVSFLSPTKTKSKINTGNLRTTSANKLGIMMLPAIIEKFLNFKS